MIVVTANPKHATVVQAVGGQIHLANAEQGVVNQVVVTSIMIVVTVNLASAHQTTITTATQHQHQHQNLRLRPIPHVQVAVDGQIQKANVGQDALKMELVVTSITTVGIASPMSASHVQVVVGEIQTQVAQTMVNAGQGVVKQVVVTSIMIVAAVNLVSVLNHSATKI